MHRFLRAIGFSGLKKSQLDELIKDIIEHPDMEKLAIDSDGSEFSEITQMFNDRFGITVCGQYQDSNLFSMDYYYPVLYADPGTKRPVFYREQPGRYYPFVYDSCDVLRGRADGADFRRRRLFLPCDRIAVYVCRM